MTGIFKQKTPGNIILLLAMGILLKLPAFFHSTGYILKQSDGDLYTHTINFLKHSTNNNAFTFVIIALAINFTIAFVLNSFINTERLTTRSNFLTGMAYLLVTSFLPAFNLLSSNLVVSLLLLGAFTLLYKSYHTRNNLFNAALLIGLASLFFVPALLFAIWAFLALAILRPFKLSEWLVLLLGLITPYYFYAAYLFLNDHWVIPDYFNHLSFLSSSITYTAWHAGALFFLLAPLLAGVYYMQANSGKMLTHVRKGWYLFIGYLVVAIGIALFDVDKTSENLLILLVPAAAFHGYGYLNAELKLYPKIAFWATVGFIILNQVYGTIWH